MSRDTRRKTDHSLTRPEDLYLGGQNAPQPAAVDGAGELRVPFSLEELRETVQAALGRTL